VFLNKCIWYKSITLALVLVLIVLILTACGKEKGYTTTPVPPSATASTATPTPSPTTSPTLTPAGPVKIGVIAPWSGPMAMSGMIIDQIIGVVENQLNNMGGILGGRQVQFVRGDDRGAVAESVAQAKKLIEDDKVTILTVGGISAAHFTAVSDVAEELKVPYVALASTYGVADKKYSACLFAQQTALGRVADFVIDVIKPKTVAFLGYDAIDSRNVLNGVEGVVGARDRWKANGIDIVYEQFFPQDSMDLSPYLTKIKYMNPDLLVTYLNNVGQAVTLNKQITELGGWGSIKYYCAAESGSTKAATTIPSALGTYVVVMWLPGSDEPGMKAFEDAFTQKYGRLPTPELTYFYNCFWTAIKAIELAGTDEPEQVAQALRSGNLEWDSAWGPLRIPLDGKGIVNAMVAQVQEGGKLVKVWPQ